MMADVDSLTRRFGSLVANHCCVAIILYTRDKSLRPLGYDHSTFKDHATARLTPPSINCPCQPVLSSRTIAASSAKISEVDIPTTSFTISTSPLLFLTPYPLKQFISRQS